MAELHWVAWAGIMIGILARTYLPFYIKKLKAGEHVHFAFDVKYVFSAIAAFIAAATTAQPLLADFVLPGTATNAVLAFWAGLVYAGLWNTLINAFALDYTAPQT